MKTSFENGREKAQEYINSKLILCKLKTINAVVPRRPHYSTDDSEIGKKWNKLNEIERKEIIRKAVPSGIWDFYKTGSWGSLFGHVQDRLEKFLK